MRFVVVRLNVGLLFFTCCSVIKPFTENKNVEERLTNQGLEEITKEDEE